VLAVVHFCSRKELGRFAPGLLAFAARQLWRPPIPRSFKTAQHRLSLSGGLLQRPLPSAPSVENSRGQRRRKMTKLMVAAVAASVAIAACQRPADVVGPRSQALARANSMELAPPQALAPNFNLEIILRATNGAEGFGHVTFRQANDDATRVDLGVWVRDLTPNTHYRLQRAVDTAIDDNCTSDAWLTLGEGAVAQDIATDDRGTAKQDLFRVLPTPKGTPFDIHFRVVTVSGAPVLASDCYQFYVR